jgi:hypothetical protein
MKTGTMKRLICILALLAIAVPSWGSRKITVAQLEELLRSLQQDKKSDPDVATALKQIELSEELTRTAMNKLIGLVMGPLTTEQIYVFEARSATLTPPPSDLPDKPAPDPAAQNAIVAKVEGYLANTYEKLPSLKATKTTLRFQDDFDALAASSGLSGSAKDVTTSSQFSKPASFIHYINSTQRIVAIEHGAEKKPAEKDETHWGANKMIAMQEPDPSLVQVFKEAQASGNIQWLRWELINGRPAAVFSFAVPKQQSKLNVNVCCFPNIKQAGIATFYTATSAAALGGGGSGPGGGVSGNFQTNTEWHDFKTVAPYHGEFFVDPDNGIVLRMITQAELKPGEVVHQLDTRTDYGAARAGPNTLIVPTKTVINSVVVPNGESGAGGYSTRCTLLTSEFKNYQLGSAH